MIKKDATQYIGKECLIRVPLSKSSIQVRVKITNHRYTFGRDDVEVEPVQGIGSGWVAADSVVLCG